MSEIFIDTHENILEQAANWRAEGRDVAIATVIKTWGSSPRPVGSQLVVDTSNNMIGSIAVVDSVRMQYLKGIASVKLMVNIMTDITRMVA